MNNNNINLKPTEKMGYINFWCQKVIPLVFDDSLSYYEAICKFMQKLNEVISALNNNAECIDELQGKYIILQNNFNALEVKWEEFKTYIENKFNTFKTEITTKEENFETTINNKQTEFETTINNKQTEFETKINGDIINLTNNINNFEETMTGEFNAFKTYVENYLNNIDVQSYVNVKIDELAESGYFNTLLVNLGFNPDNYLAKNNTTMYVPTNDYNPATKKYVDEHSSQGASYNAGDGIKIENNTISSTSSNLTNLSNMEGGIGCKNNKILFGSVYINNVKYDGNNKDIPKLGFESYNKSIIIGNDNTTKLANNLNGTIIGDGNNVDAPYSLPLVIGSSNTVDTNNADYVIIGNNNNGYKKSGNGSYMFGFALKDNQERNIIIGKLNQELNSGNNIIFGNGTNNNRHNAIVIPEGTTNPISINQEVNCSNNFITRTFVEGDNVDTIYAEKPNALVNASEVKASFDLIQSNFDELNHNIIYGNGTVNFESNITGNGEVDFNGLPGSPLILYIKFTHPGKTTGVADPEFKVGTIDLSGININKDYLPRYINAFVNSYPCIISLRTTDNANVYDIYYDGNAIPESVGATNFIVKCNQIIGITI